MNPPADVAQLPDGRAAVVLGRYPLRTEAYERALVVAAMEIAHWILREGENDDETFLLCVEPPDAEAAAREIAAWEAERAGEKSAAPAPGFAAGEKVSPLSLWVAAWTGTIFFLLQNRAPAWWSDAGASSSRAVMRGEWWRVFTALTLHADFSHIGANLAAMLVFAGFLLPIFGGGWTWLGIVATGALGNLLNAWGHRGEPHISIGSSTAVFGALGLLVGAQIVLQSLALRRARIREILVPLGAGFAWLAWFGVGGKETDFTAHFWGLFMGLPLGAAGAFLRLKRRTPAAVQIALGLSALAALALAWMAAAGSVASGAPADFPARQSLSPNAVLW